MIYAKFEGKDRKPRMHPGGQVIGDEWRIAAKAGGKGNWDNISLSYIELLCKTGRATNPIWHPDLTATDIGWYINEMP
jgi:hypothetical protein